MRHRHNNNSRHNNNLRRVESEVRLGDQCVTATTTTASTTTTCVASSPRSGSAITRGAQRSRESESRPARRHDYNDNNNSNGVHVSRRGFVTTTTTTTATAASRGTVSRGDGPLYELSRHVAIAHREHLPRPRGAQALLHGRGTEVRGQVVPRLAKEAVRHGRQLGGGVRRQLEPRGLAPATCVPVHSPRSSRDLGEF